MLVVTGWDFIRPYKKKGVGPVNDMKAGLLIVDKPEGMSSFDVVRKTRRLANMRKVGHTGTLDPDATGVLPVALGRCTKLSKFVAFDEKKYAFTMCLGVATDSADASGDVIQRAPYDEIRREDVESALAAFRGEIQQVPPVYSAIKVDGERAYALARSGKDVKLEARTVEIYDMELTEWNPPQVSFIVRCGPGTYVRSLARDIAIAVGTVGHAERIRRLAVGPFTIEQAVSFDELRRENFWSLVSSPLEMVQSLSRVCIGEEQRERIQHGRPITAEGDWEVEEAVAGHDSDNRLVAVMECTKREKGRAQLWPRRVMI